MKYLRYVALLALLAMPLAYSQAAVIVGGVGVGVGVGPGYVGDAPACAYGYYPDYPYACAPYGYYGPSWFSGGVFIGAGPWYHGGWGRPGWGHAGWGRPYARGFAGPRGFAGRGFEGRGFEAGHGFAGHGVVASRGGFHGGGFHGGGSRGGR
jgi:hypothetical protein